MAKKEKTADDKSKEEKQHDVEEHDEDTSDFGGLPDRDLKKNLGCG